MSKKVISAVKIWADSIEAVSLLMVPFSHEPAKNWQTMPSGPMCVMVPSSIRSGKTTKVSFLGINVENPRDSMAISPCWPSKPEDCLVILRSNCMPFACSHRHPDYSRILLLPFCVYPNLFLVIILKVSKCVNTVFALSFRVTVRICYLIYGTCIKIPV